MAKEIKDMGASVRARLQNLSRANGQSFDLVLTRFALERVLFRHSNVPLCRSFRTQGCNAADELVRGSVPCDTRS